MNKAAEIVSFDDESLILVNSDDTITGYANKDKAHDGKGLLHRAFSLFIFNSSGELLLQQRGLEKRLWGGFWSNSVCSHPRQGESLEIATQRRLLEELGFCCPLEFLYKFEYQASYATEGSENELCSVLIGKYDGKVTANSTEINNWRWINPGQLDKEILNHEQAFTPWFKMEWLELNLNWINKTDTFITTKEL